jgi:hypothetical protein
MLRAALCIVISLPDVAVFTSLVANSVLAAPNDAPYFQF